MNISKIIFACLSFISIQVFNSCNKDSDLFADLVISNEINGSKKILLNDSYIIIPNTSVVLDVLSNDNIKETDEVEIIKTSNPINGIVIINDNRTLTYIPVTTPETTTPETTTPETTTSETTTSETTTSETDSFTYTVEVTNEDNTTTTQEANVSIVTDENASTSSTPSSMEFPSGENIFYVTTNGSSSNNGKTEATAWNIEKAFNVAKQGDIIYIKNGHYNISSPLTISNKGEQSNPIAFIGYKLIPNDIISTPYSSFNYKEDLFNSNFPLIISSNDKGIDIETNYVELKNVAITGKSFGIHIKGSHNIVDNCVFGDLGTKGNTGYDGFGIIIEGNYNEVINCYGENVASEAYSIWDGSSYNRIAYCDYRNDDENLQTDYQYTTRQISFNNVTEYNIIENNKAYRYHNGEHKGHGLNNKGGSNNIWKENYIYRLPIQTAFATSYDNIFTKNIAIGYESCEIQIRSGAHNNTYDGNYIEVEYTAIVMGHALDGATSNSDVVKNNSGHDNILINNILVGGQKGISIGEGSPQNTVNTNNKIINNTFYGQSIEMIGVYANTINLELINNSFSNSIAHAWIRVYSSEIKMTVENCNFYNNVNFETPNGENYHNITELNPMFINPENGDFSLNDSSPLINSGKNTPYLSSYNGKKRPNGNNHDIGAYEY